MSFAFEIAPQTRLAHASQMNSFAFALELQAVATKQIMSFKYLSILKSLNLNS